MSDELGKMLKHYFSKPFSIYGDNAIEEIIEKIRSLCKSERKKRALGLLGKEKKTLPRGLGSPNNPAQARINGYNQCRAEIRKKIEED